MSQLNLYLYLCTDASPHHHRYRCRCRSAADSASAAASNSNSLCFPPSLLPSLRLTQATYLVSIITISGLCPMLLAHLNGDRLEFQGASWDAALRALLHGAAGDEGGGASGGAGGGGGFAAAEREGAPRRWRMGDGSYDAVARTSKK